MFKDVQSYYHYEGSRWKIERENDSVSESPYQKISASVEVSADEVPSLTHDKIAQKFDRVALEFADQMEKGFFDTLLKEMETGNRVLRGDNREFDQDVFLEGLRSMMISFDKLGNPNMPTMFVSPQMGKNLSGKLQAWEEDDEFKKRFDLLIEQKREEWRARESNRRLVE